MVRKVSKEFVEAMNGVLNREEWKSGGYIYKLSCDGVLISSDRNCFNMCIDETYMVSSTQMQATDWERIN